VDFIQGNQFSCPTCPEGKWSKKLRYTTAIVLYLAKLNANTGPYICRLYVVEFENDFKFVANISNKLYFYNGQMDKVYLYAYTVRSNDALSDNSKRKYTLYINKRFTYPASLGHSLHILPHFSDSSPSIRSQLIED
jgi:hypothetical protein